MQPQIQSCCQALPGPAVAQLGQQQTYWRLGQLLRVVILCQLLSPYHPYLLHQQQMAGILWLLDCRMRCMWAYTDHLLRA